MKFIYSQRNSKKKVYVFSFQKKILNYILNTSDASFFFLHQHKHEKSLTKIYILSKANLIKKHPE